MSDVVGCECVFVGKIYVGGVWCGLGYIEFGVIGKLIYIGEFDGCIMLCVWVIVDVFDGVGFVMMISDNIVGMMWDKLLVNVVMGVLMGFMGFIYG